MVMAIPVGSDNALEQLACALVDLAKEGLLAAACIPVIPDSNRLTVLQLEACYVYGIGLSMFAARARLTVVAVAAGVGPPMVDSGHRLSEMTFSSRLKDPFFENGECGCQLTTGLEFPVQAD